MSEIMTSGLQNALRAAVESNGTNGHNASHNGAAPNDLMGLAMKLLPALLDNVQQRDEMAETQKNGAAAMRKEVLLLRRDLRDLLQSHLEMIEEVRRLRKLQSSMVAHLARVQIMEPPEDDDQFYEDAEDEIDEETERAMRSKARRKARAR
jgi:hypothetical protein